MQADQQRSNLPRSNAARRQKGLDCKHLRTRPKYEEVPLHDLHLNQAVMYQDPNGKRWYPATITRGTIQKKLKLILKPYQPQDENKDEDELCNQAKHKWAAQGAQTPVFITNLVQSRPKRDISLLLDWTYSININYLVFRL